MVNEGKINSFRVSEISNSATSSTVTVDFDINTPPFRQYEATLTIKSPNLNPPLALSFGDQYSEIAQIKMIGWKDDTLSGQTIRKDGQVFSSTTTSIQNLFTSPQTTYEFELFIRPLGESIATAVERRSITIK
jgi:hypothetical protein